MGQQACCQPVQNKKEQIILNNQISMANVADRTQNLSGTSIFQYFSQQFETKADGPNQSVGYFLDRSPELNEQVLQKITDFNPFQRSKYLERGNEVYSCFLFKRTGIAYEGQWLVMHFLSQKGKPHGQGINYYPNGAVYAGSFQQGIPHGQGCFIKPNGESYNGQIKFGRANGQGIYESSEAFYHGQFKDNKKHGFGEQKGKDYYFKGTYKYGQKVKGILRFQGHTYQGEFMDDRYHGKGVLVTPQGRYAGAFKNGFLHGYGQFTWENGSSFRGNYQFGEKQGDGQYYNKHTSQISRGYWRKGLLQGRGQFVSSKGKTYHCIWQHGKITETV